MGRIKSLTLALLIPFVQIQAEPKDRREHVVIPEYDFFSQVINPESNDKNWTRGVNALLLYPTTKKVDGDPQLQTPYEKGFWETYSSIVYDKLSGNSYYYDSRDPTRDSVPFEKDFLQSFLKTASIKSPLVRKVEGKVKKVQNATKIKYTSSDEVKFSLEPVVNLNNPGIKASVRNVLFADEIYLRITGNKQTFGIEKKLSQGELRFGIESGGSNSGTTIGLSFGSSF